MIVFFRAFHYTESLKANLTAKTFPVKSVSPHCFCMWTQHILLSPNITMRQQKIEACLTIDVGSRFLYRIIPIPAVIFSSCLPAVTIECTHCSWMQSFCHISLCLVRYHVENLGHSMGIGPFLWTQLIKVTVTIQRLCGQLGGALYAYAVPPVRTCIYACAYAYVASENQPALPLPRLINFNFPLQPHQKYNITQYEELSFS